MGKGGDDYGKREIITSKRTDPDVFPAWAKDIQECEKHYRVNKKSGLSSVEVENRRKIYGYNELEKHEGQSICMNRWLCRHAASIDAATKRSNERDLNRRAEYI